jgi:hypothetical protein
MIGTIVVGPVGGDGQSLYDQSDSTQALFTSTWGNAAAQRWADEHDAGISK